LRSTIWPFLLKLALAAALLAWLSVEVEWREIAAAVSGAHPGWLLGAALLLPLNLWLESHRWHRLVLRVAPDVSAGEAFRAVLSGYPIGLLTPGRVGDYAGRALALRGRGTDGWTLAALTFAERMATLACCLVVGLVAVAVLLATQTEIANPAWGTLFVCALVATAGFVALLLQPRRARAVLAAVLPFEKVRRLLGTLDPLKKSDAQRLLALSLVRYGVFSTQFVLLVRAFDAAAPLGWTAVSVALVFFAKSAVPSFTLADLGIREGFAVYFMALYGIAEAAAFNGALALFALNILTPALVGLPLALRLRVTADAPSALEPVADR
jgi:uncharacterized membrane protein YbhN (UPF0104 family)